MATNEVPLEVEGVEVEAENDAAELKGSDNVSTICSDSEYAADITFIVEGRKILTSKHVVSLASPIFRAMFEGNFKEKSSDEIELPGKTFEDFKEFLACIYPSTMKPVTSDNVLQVLPLADEYQVSPLIGKCEDVLLTMVGEDSSAEDVFHLLSVAARYHLHKLREKSLVFAKCTNFDDCKEQLDKYEIDLEMKYEVLLGVGQCMSDRLKDTEMRTGIFNYSTTLTQIANSKGCRIPVVTDRLKNETNVDGTSFYFSWKPNTNFESELRRLGSFDFQVCVKEQSWYDIKLLASPVSKQNVYWSVVVLHPTDTKLNKITGCNFECSTSEVTLEGIPRDFLRHKDWKQYVAYEQLKFEVHILLLG